jgi:hypothetical protein
MIVAIPLAGTLKIILTDLVALYRKSEFFRSGTAAGTIKRP